MREIIQGSSGLEKNGRCINSDHSKRFILKKLQQNLSKIEKALTDHGLMSTDLEAAIASLKAAIEKVPETVSKSLGGLTAPGELKTFPQGLALYTDGACRGNPGPGSWACVAQNHDGQIIFESCGHEILTTNNKMEIQAVIGALHQLEGFLLAHPMDQFKPIFLYTDSKYVCDGLNQWVMGWKSRGWKKADGKAPENLELWQEIDLLKSRFPDVEIRWVKGHSGHPQNEYCDQLANRLLDDEGF